MSTTDTTKITASEWLEVRRRVHAKVREGVTGNTQENTTLRITEKLLEKGYIDIDAVLQEIKDEEVERERIKREREERDAAAREAEAAP